VAGSEEVDAGKCEYGKCVVVWSTGVRITV
jgi:hypothetical protein